MTTSTKPGYQVLQDAIEELTALLGGHTFCRVALAKTAADLLKDPVTKRLGGYFGTVRMYPGQLLLATDDELIQVAASLRHLCTFERDGVATHASAPLQGAAITLRGSSVLYESSGTSLCLAYAYRNDHPDDHNLAWTALLTDAGEAFVRHFPGAKEPARTIVHSKTEDAARASLIRFVEKSFGIPLNSIL